MTIDKYNTPTLLPYNKAIEIADKLNSDKDDDWNYKVVDVNEKYAKIGAYDENNDFVQYL